MATSKEYLAYVLEQLSDLEEISHKSMMGEYIIYYHGRIAAYICDNRFLVKPVKAAAALIPDGRYEPPYEGAKDMLLVERLDEKAFMTTLFKAIYDELPEPKKKKQKGTDKA